MKKNHSTTHFYIPFMLLIMFVFQTTSAANSLSGKYFIKDSPFLAGYYPNDFLPWGIILFLGAGWLLNRSLLLIKNQTYRNIAVGASSMLGFLVFFILDFCLDSIYPDINFRDWNHSIGELLLTWAISWLIGCLWAQNMYRFEKEKTETVS